MTPAVIGWIVAVMGSAQDWAGVDFGRVQLDQVVSYATEKMLDPPVQGTLRSQTAWRRSAQMVAWNLSPVRDLVPIAYLAELEAKGWTPKHPPTPVPCEKSTIPGLALAADEVWNRDKTALAHAWDVWHAQHVFDRKELLCLLRWVDTSLSADPLRTERLAAAWINAASGWLKALDRHSDILAARYWDRAREPDQVAPQADLGLTLGPCAADPAQCCVTDVRPDGPAWKADIRVRDRVRSVDGADACADSTLLRGPERSVAAVSWWNGRKGKTKVLQLRRSFAVAHDVETAVLAPGLLYLRLGDFVPGTALRVRGALQAGTRIRGKKAAWRGVIVDLRGNTGGVLDEATAIADQLLPGGVIVRTRWVERSGAPEARTQADDLTLPVVLLVDRMCASACEVLTGALQDHRRALVLGETTLGKASMQRIIKPTLMANFYVKVTVGRYLTPLGRDLDGQGTEPDVALPADATTVWPQVPQHAELVGSCVTATGQAPSRLAKEPWPRRRADPWLQMAWDGVACMASTQVHK